MTIYFDNGRGIKVTDTHLTTRLKDEALAPVESVVIGIEPLLISATTGSGLALFAFQFGDLLFWQEQALLAFIGMLLIIGGCSTVSLRIGRYMHEKTVLWSNIWTVRKVRNAIAESRQQNATSGSSVVISPHVE